MTSMLQKAFLFLLIVSFPCSLIAETGKELIRRYGLKQSVAPMIKTHWSQDGGENCMLPFINQKGTVKADTGCGATALAQILKFWEYPSHGNSFNYYYWSNISGQEQVLYADFEHTNYDWDNMALIYKNNTTITKEQLNAVGTLMAHIGVALEMKYDRDGSATQIEYIHSVLKKYFGYNPYMRLVRMINGAYSMDEWLVMIYQELSEGRPILMGGRYTGSDGKTADHIFIADGYDNEGKVHLNLGKADSGFNKDTYYDLAKQGVTYNENMRMIIGITPYHIGEELTTVNVVTPGLLSDLLGGERSTQRICRLKITGIINKEDLSLIKRMSAVTTGQLSYLDLSECVIDGNSIPERAFSECYTLQEILLPDDVTEIREAAFYGCRGLLSIHLPENLIFLERYSLDDCRYLESIKLPQHFSRFDNNPLSRAKLSLLEIDLGNESYQVRNGALLSNSGKTIYSMPTKHKGKYIIPNGVEKIGVYAFRQCCMIDTLVIPASIKNLGRTSFTGCYGLKHVLCYAPTPPDMYAAFDNGSSCVLHVPVGCADVYTAAGWLDMFAIIVDDLQYPTGLDNPHFYEYQEHKYYNLSGEEVNTMAPNRLYIFKDKTGKWKKGINTKRN